jgi:hypothetical protein
MELLSDQGQVEAHFGLLEDSVNIGVRKVHVCAECTMGTKIFLAALDEPPR